MIDPKVRVQQSRSFSAQTKPLTPLEGSTKKAPANAVSEHDVRVYAYELYQRRGGTGAHAVEDGLTAEAHLTADSHRANQAIAG